MRRRAETFNKIFGNDVFKEDMLDRLGSCDMSDIRFEKGLKSMSASATDLWIGTVRNTTFKVFMKVFLADYKTKDKHLDFPKFLNPLLLEQHYYTITTALYHEGKTRNVLPMIASSSSCLVDSLRNFVSSDEQMRRNFDRNMRIVYLQTTGSKCAKDRPAVQDNDDVEMKSESCQRIWYASNSKMDSFGFIMTPKMDPADLPGLGKVEDMHQYVAAILNRPDFKTHLDDLTQYLFQIAFTLTAFQNMKFNHNDLHLSNIMLTKPFAGESSTATYTWTAGKNTYSRSVNAPLVPRIFDYDRSTKSGDENKAVAHKHGDFWNLEHFQQGRDLFWLACNIYAQFTRIRDNKTRTKLLAWVMHVFVRPYCVYFRELFGERDCNAYTQFRLRSKAINMPMLNRPERILRTLAVYLPQNTLGHDNFEIQLEKDAEDAIMVSFSGIEGLSTGKVALETALPILKARYVQGFTSGDRREFVENAMTGFIDVRAKFYHESLYALVTPRLDIPTLASHVPADPDFFRSATPAIAKGIADFVRACNRKRFQLNNLFPENLHVDEDNVFRAQDITECTPLENEDYDLVFAIYHYVTACNLFDRDNTEKVVKLYCEPHMKYPDQLRDWPWHDWL